MAVLIFEAQAVIAQPEVIASTQFGIPALRGCVGVAVAEVTAAARLHILQVLQLVVVRLAVVVIHACRERDDVGHHLHVGIAVDAQVQRLVVVLALRLAAVEGQLAVLVGIHEEVVEQVAILRRVGIKLCRAVGAPAVARRIVHVEPGSAYEPLRRIVHSSIGTEALRAVAVVVGLPAVGVAAGEVGLRRGPRVGVAVVVRAVDADACRELVVEVAIVVADVGHTHRGDALGRLRLEGGRVGTHRREAVALVVQVVERALHRQARLSLRVDTQQAGQVAVVGAAAHLGIAEGADGVLLLQAHVHHEALVVHVAPHHLRQLALAVEHLDFVHRVGGKVFQGRLGVALEEVAPVDQQVVYLLAVHLDLAVLVQLGSGQLAYQCVEH